MLKSTPRVKQPAADGVSTLTLRRVFDAEETPLLRYAFRLTGRRAVAEEIVQEVFLQLHARWGEIDSPRKWLFRSVRNRAFDHLRKHRREIIGDEESATASAADASATSDAMILRREASARLRQLIDELGDTDRQLVNLKYFEGLKYREISERTGLSIGNVGYRLHHILKQLAERLRPFGIDDIS